MRAQVGWNAVEESRGSTSDILRGNNRWLCHGILRLRSAHLTTSAPLRMTPGANTFEGEAYLFLILAIRSLILEGVARMSDQPPVAKSEAIGLSDDQFLEQFEACTYPYAHWTHRAHLRVAYCYVTRYGLADAIPKVTAGIRAYNQSQGIVDTPTSGYHETMTIAWLYLVAAMLAEYGPTGAVSSDSPPLLGPDAPLSQEFPRGAAAAPGEEASAPLLLARPLQLPGSQIRFCSARPGAIARGVAINCHSIMWFLFIWGRQRREKRLGNAADFCPVCRQIRAFEIQEVRMAKHLYFIPVERGIFQHHSQACLTCRTVLNSQPGRFQRLARSEGKSIEELVQTTFPTIHTAFAARLALEEKVAAGGEGIDSRARQQLLMEPFALAEPHFATGYGQEGRRILALALRPLRPTEEEIRACLTRYRSGFSRMGALLRTADLMTAIYPELKPPKAGSFDYWNEREPSHTSSS